jgi:hypothetical protein
MLPGIYFKYLYHDNDIIELQVTAFNGRFGGTTNVYVDYTQLSETAKGLEDFPRNSSDNRQFVFGAFGSKFAGGGVRLRFYCKDLAGHVAVEAMVEDDYRFETTESRFETTESATLLLNVEPAAIDEFGLGIRRLENELTGTATLVTIP